MNCWPEITSFDTSRDVNTCTCCICHSNIRRHLFLSVVFFFIVIVPFVIVTMIMIMVVVAMRMIMSTTRMIMVRVFVDLKSLWILCSFRFSLCFSCFSLSFALPFLVLYCLSNNVSNQPQNRGDTMQTSCHPHNGRNESKKPTSSNKFGYSQNPGGIEKTVITNSNKRKRAMAKNNPNNPSIPMLKYQTPNRSFKGQRGNNMTAKTRTTAPPA